MPRRSVVGKRLALVALILVSGCLTRAAELDRPTPASDLVDMPDPAAMGSLHVALLQFDLGYMTVTEPRTMVAPFPSRLIGNVHYPRDADGPFPVVLFMHGRHATCGVRPLGAETLGPVVCPDNAATYPVDSYTGYDYIGEQLASHGYVVISVSANNVNDLDAEYGDAGAQSRAQIIVRVLDDFKGFNSSAGPEPIGSRLAGKMDFGRIGLMGHSRGGEGVTRAITYNRDRTDGTPHAIKAVFALAPTDFARWPAPDVAFATLLPYCDGDVSNLQGAWMYDDARYLDEKVPSAKIQILAFGSNHNFYNTVWTSNDGARFRADGHCSAVKENQTGEFSFLGPEDQRRHGLVYMSAFFRAYVGGEDGFIPLFTGQADPPPSACPEAQPTCRGMIHISYHAPADARLVIEDTSDETTFTKNDRGGATMLDGFSNKTICVPTACPTKPTYGAASQLVLGWDRPGARAMFTFDSVDVRDHDVLSLRLGVAGGDPRNPPDESKPFTLRLFDAHGANASVLVANATALFEPPGGSAQKTTLNMVAVPLESFAIDRAAITGIEFVFDAQPKGLVHLTDLLFQRLP
jgi:hypothetical protein